MHAVFGAFNQIFYIWLIHWIKGQLLSRFCDKFEVIEILLSDQRLRHFSTGPTWSQGDSFIHNSTVGREGYSFWPWLCIDAVNRSSLFFAVSSQVQCSLKYFGGCAVLWLYAQWCLCTCNSRVFWFIECCFVSILNEDFVIMLKRAYKMFLVWICI